MHLLYVNGDMCMEKSKHRKSCEMKSMLTCGIIGHGVVQRSALLPLSAVTAR